MTAVQADDLLRALETTGEAALRPWFLVMGEEAFLADAVTRKLRQVAAVGGIDGFNEDKFTAGETHVDTVLAAVRSVPMMAKRRFVLVRSLERWEGKGDDAPPAKGKGKGAEHPLDRLASYVTDPSPMATMVLVADKLHGQRRIVTAAKKANVLVSCDPIKRGGAGPWVFARAKALGHPISRDVAEHVVDLIGGELGPLAEALDRLCLYVGPGATISDEAVSKLIAPVRHAAMWDLTDAVCGKNLKKALKVLGELELGRGQELPTLGAIASSVRKLAKFGDRIAAGDSPQSAAEAAGVPPFKAQDMAQALRGLAPGTLSRWLLLLARTDVDLKGGAKRGSRAILEGMVVSMCQSC